MSESKESTRCPACNGAGIVLGVCPPRPHDHACPACDGSGRVTTLQGGGSP